MIECYLKETVWPFSRQTFSLQEEDTVQGAGWVFHDFPSHFLSRALHEQPHSTELERAGDTSGAAGGPQALWLGEGGQG